MNFLSKLHAELFGSNMQRLVKEKELKVDDVCAGLHICRSNFYRIVNGKKDITHDDMKKIAAFFEVPVEEMIKPVNIDISLDADVNQITEETVFKAKIILSAHLCSMENIDLWAEESNEIHHIVSDSARYVKE